MLYAQAPPRVIWFDAPGDGQAILELRTEDRVGPALPTGRSTRTQWSRHPVGEGRHLGSSVVDAFCLDFGEADTRAARERVEEAVLAVVPVPQPKKKED